MRLYHFPFFRNFNLADKFQTAESRVVDMSAIEALNKLTARYAKHGKKVHLKHLSQDCLQLLNNADAIIDINILEDPTYKVLVDKLS